MFRTHARARDLAALTGAVAIVGLCVSRWSASGRLSMLQAHADSRDGFPGTGSLLYHKGDDANAFAVDLGAASKKERLLTARDDAARSAARQHASADLNRYDVAFSEGLDEYARRSKKIDALSRRVFVKYRPQKKPAKPAYDPLSDVRNVWEKWGANSEPVLGVPQEYDGWKATATAHPSTLKHLPDYVVRAQRELGGGAVASVANGWHSHPVRPPRGQSRGRDAHRHAPAAPAALKPQAAAIVSSASAHTTAPRPSPVEPASGAGTRSSADAQSPPEMVQTAAEPQPEADEAPAQTTAASTTRGADTSLGAGRAGGGEGLMPQPSRPSCGRRLYPLSAMMPRTRQLIRMKPRTCQLTRTRRSLLLQRLWTLLRRVQGRVHLPQLGLARARPRRRWQW